MESILIDPSTGNVGTSSLLQTSFTPSFHKGSIGRVIKNTLNLPSYNGPKTKKTKIGRANVFNAPLDTCIFIIDNVQGERWNTWRENEGEAFKRALREGVQTVCSRELQQSGQVTKESVLKDDLKRAGIEGDIRVDEPTGLGSIHDVINLMCPEMSDDYAAKTLSRIIEKEEREATLSRQGRHDGSMTQDSLGDRIKKLQINGTRRFTPVGDAKTMIEIIWLLPARQAKDFRRRSAETICRVLGGDKSICREIEQRCSRLQSSEEGRAFQRFVTGEEREGPPAKKSRIGPKIMEHATDEDYDSFVKTEVTHALAIRHADQAHELALRNTKSIKEELQNEVSVVWAIKDAFESIRPLDDMQKIEFCDKISDIQYRMFKKLAVARSLQRGVRWPSPPQSLTPHMWTRGTALPHLSVTRQFEAMKYRSHRFPGS